MLDRKGKTMEEHIQTGANIFAEAEDAARKIKANFRTLRKVFEAVRDAGHIGALDWLKLTANIEGMIAAACAAAFSAWWIMGLVIRVLRAYDKRA